MKVFSHERPGLVVRANAAQLELLIKLIDEKLLESPERAIRAAGANVFAAFHNFSTHHIQEAVDEAKKLGSTDAHLAAIEGPKERHEAVLASVKAKAEAAKTALKAALAVKPAPTAPAASPKPPVTSTDFVTN